MSTATTAPMDWAWLNTPLSSEGDETLCLDTLALHAHAVLDRIATTGDRAPLGEVLHWAHLLQIAQADAGDWPAVVNARTGEPLSAARTRAPAALMLRLGRLLHSVEFDDAIARAGFFPDATEPTPGQPAGKELHP